MLFVGVVLFVCCFDGRTVFAPTEFCKIFDVFFVKVFGFMILYNTTLRYGEL